MYYEKEIFNTYTANCVSLGCSRALLPVLFNLYNFMEKFMHGLNNFPRSYKYGKTQLGFKPKQSMHLNLHAKSDFQK